MRRGGRLLLRSGDDPCCVCGIAVELVICAFIGPQRRAIQGYAGEYAARTGVAQNLGAHKGVCIGCRRTSLWSAGYRCVRSELYLAVQQAACAAIVYHEKDEVCCLAASLQTKAPTFERVHSRRSPWTSELLA